MRQRESTPTGHGGGGIVMERPLGSMPTAECHFSGGLNSVFGQNGPKTTFCARSCPFITTIRNLAVAISCNRSTGIVGNNRGLRSSGSGFPPQGRMVRIGRKRWATRPRSSLILDPSSLTLPAPPFRAAGVRDWSRSTLMLRVFGTLPRSACSRPRPVRSGCGAGRRRLAGPSP